ncbi:MAG: glycosyltransferase family 4 protein [Candidatus Nanoarchaeia archaeon]|nr:glycosyltransferase family 4 protein [Candidatus Nanoarchaeia archaeon]
MNILMVLYQNFPPDIRVEKEAKSLIAAGHNVFVIGKKSMETVEKHNEVTIINLKPNIFDSLMFMLNFHKPFLSKRIKQLIKQYNIDVVHVHDLPLVKTALKSTKLPVIADLHENYPAAMEVYAKANKKVINKLFYWVLSKKRYKNYELKVLKKTFANIIVVPEAYTRFEGKITKEKFFVVSNTVDFENFKESKFKSPKNKFIATYVGGFNLHRGIDTCIKAIPHIKESRFRLSLIGGKGPYDAEMKALSKKLGVEDRVSFEGWKSFSEIQRFIEESNICLVPHNDFEHTQTTVPHKLFQYMLLKKPVLVSDCAPLKRIIEETHSGKVFKADNPKDFAKKINEFMKLSDVQMQEYGFQGNQAVNKSYNWNIDTKELLNLYSKLRK